MISLQLYTVNFRGRRSQKPFKFSLAGREPNEATTNDSTDKTLKFRATELMYLGDTCVYRGVLVGYDSREIKVVCKLAINPGRRDLNCYRWEAKTYETTLRDMQGRCIPLFYGLYTGIAFHENAACILTEDCGVSIGHYGKISVEWRIKAVEILMAIHKRGLQHNDFCPRNIVVDDLQDPQRLVVIDFGHSTFHECDRKMDLAAYIYPPIYQDFNCHELYLVAGATEVWTPPSLGIYGTYVFVAAFETPEELLAECCYGATPKKPTREALLYAETVIRDYYKIWGHRDDYTHGIAYKVLSPAM